MFLGNFRAVFRNASYPLDMPEAGDGVPVAWIKLPKDLFNIHCRFFLRSRALVDKLEHVLDNMEHRLYMEEGRILGYAMPEEDRYRHFIHQYKGRFATFNPFETSTQNGQVTLRGDQAKAFVDNRRLSAELYDMLDEGIFQTEYMDMIRHLKHLGAPYYGPSIFQEIMDWQMEALAMAKTENEVIACPEATYNFVTNLIQPKTPALASRQVQNPAEPQDNEQTSRQAFAQFMNKTFSPIDLTLDS